ncbi:unnamed protein product [Mytilus coruscus]|uniref:Ig-like domain-containing protein n=1 Tax=Mytilus coruscus TaxID=42192 RepID=A0A6J8CX48_MYTCO|nr:unnamed protein product [Mytilus coruscus]
MRTVTATLLVLTRLYAIGDNFEGAVILATTGDTITLKCPLLSLHSPDVQWTHIDSKTVYSDGFDINPTIVSKTERTKFEIVGNHDIGEYNLKIRNIEIDDKGVYRCDSDINGKPESRFVNLILDKYQTEIGIDSDDYTTDVYNEKTQGFSIYKWIIIFTSAIIGILVLSMVVAGAFKTIRSNPSEPDNNIDTERASETLYETINDTEVISSHASPLPCSNLNVSRLQVYALEAESFSVHSPSTNTQSSFNAPRSPPNQPDVLFSTSLHNKDSNSEASSTHSFGTSSLCLVYETPYINHYHQLGRSCERVSHVYDEC